MGISNQAEGQWEVPEWFKELVLLGIKLGNLKEPETKLSHLLIAVPRAEPAAFALGVGLSLSSFMKRTTQAIEVDLEELGLGELIQMRSAWRPVATKPHTWLSPANTVGELVEIRKSGDGSRHTIRLETDRRTTKPTAVMSHISPRGSKLPDKHIRFYRVPDGTPRRVSESPLEIKDEQIDFWTWEAWEYQISPTLAVFGNSTTISEVSTKEIHTKSLNSDLPEIPKATLWELARFDRLTNDIRPHFINSYDQISSYPLIGTREFRTLQRFPFVCFSGNAAIRNLVDEDGLEGKTIIGLWEQGNGTLQDESFVKFKAEADRGVPVKNPEDELGFKIPSMFPLAAWRPNA